MSKRKPLKASYNADWWEVCSLIEGINTETRCRCLANSWYARALAQATTVEIAEREALQAYVNCGGKNPEAMNHKANR